MSNGNIQFDIDTQPRVAPQVKTSKFVRWVIKYSGGLVKDESQANYVLVAFAVVAFSVSIFLFIGLATPKNMSSTPIAPAYEGYKKI